MRCLLCFFFVYTSVFASLPYESYPLAINPSYPSCASCGISSELTYLYWRPYQDNHHYVTVVTSDQKEASVVQGTSLDQAFTTNQVKDVKYDWNSGFRICLGYDVPSDYWTLRAAWTHYATKEHAHFHHNRACLIPFFLPNYNFTSQGALEYYARAFAWWKIDFNQIDVTLQRRFILGRGVLFTPSIGLRGLYFKEHYTIDVAQTLDEATHTIFSRLYQDFRSVGLHLGVETDYELFCSIFFTGRLGLSSVYGHLDSTHRVAPNRYEARASRSGGLEAVRDFNCIRNALDLSVGLQWETLTSDLRQLFYVKLAWEHHTLFDQNNLLTVHQSFYEDKPSSLTSAKPTGGNLYLYGWTLTFGTTF